MKDFIVKILASFGGSILFLIFLAFTQGNLKISSGGAWLIFISTASLMIAFNIDNIIRYVENKLNLPRE